MTSLETSLGAKQTSPSLPRIADVFVRYANFTLGGGSATTAVIHGEIVDRRHWVSEEQFALSFALGRLTPGTNLLAFCTGIGWLLRRGYGAQAAIKGAIAAAVAITVKTVWTIAHPHFKPGNRLRVILVGASGFALRVFAGLSPITVLLIAAVVGCFLPEPS